MRMFTRFITLTVVLAATSACSMLNMQPEAAAVEMRDATDVADCFLLDTVTEKSNDRWASTRTDVKITNEVLAMARKEAAKLGGNTLVEQSELVMGRQTFTVYNCPD